MWGDVNQCCIWPSTNGASIRLAARRFFLPSFCCCLRMVRLSRGLITASSSAASGRFLGRDSFFVRLGARCPRARSGNVCSAPKIEALGGAAALVSAPVPRLAPAAAKAPVVRSPIEASSAPSRGPSPPSLSSLSSPCSTRGGAAFQSNSSASCGRRKGARRRGQRGVRLGRLCLCHETRGPSCLPRSPCDRAAAWRVVESAR
mmetsp:Transcript_48920/g.158481  ORF Transcript_48920/g.158481 Transcript_48920/m.158481 type:complete len:203 (+) Transcript_48920:71-679(+)